MYTTDNIILLKDKLGIAFIILIVTWLFCNYMVKKLLIRYMDINELVEATVKTRKTIFFAFIVLVITSIIRIRIITWIALIYYEIIFILMGGSLFLSILEIFMPNTDNRFNKELWILPGINTTNFIIHFLMAYILSNVVYQLY